MRSSRRLTLVGVVAAALFVLASSGGASAASAKKFQWTTTSKEAADLASQIVVQIETMSAGAATLAQAQKTVELDPNFAFGHYLVATFSGQDPAAVKAATDKAVALSANASEGEREYIAAVV